MLLLLDPACRVLFSTVLRPHADQSSVTSLTGEDLTTNRDIIPKRSSCTGEPVGWQFSGRATLERQHAATGSLKMISFSNINKQYGKQLLFVDASFQLNPGEKVGLVGPNGAGKTTLFRMVVGEETPDDGMVSVPKKTTIGYLRQDVEEMQGRSVLDEA